MGASPYPAYWPNPEPPASKNGYLGSIEPAVWSNPSDTNDLRRLLFLPRQTSFGAEGGRPFFWERDATASGAGQRVVTVAPSGNARGTTVVINYGIARGRTAEAAAAADREQLR